MKQFLTFENIVGVALVIAAMINWSNVSKRLSQLGELRRATLRGIRYTDFSQLLLIILALCMWFVAFLTSTRDSSNVIFFVSFIIAILVFLLTAVYTVIKPAGFYAHGIVTGSVIIMYNEVLVYDAKITKDGNAVRFVFNSRGKFFSNGIRLFVKKDEEAEIRELIKKHCKFKKQ